jgi:hypothetical protein
LVGGSNDSLEDFLLNLGSSLLGFRSARGNFAGSLVKTSSGSLGCKKKS